MSMMHYGAPSSAGHRSNWIHLYRGSRGRVVPVRPLDLSPLQIIALISLLFDFSLLSQRYYDRP